MEQHTDTTPAHRPVVRLTRSRDERMIAGVCGGAARAYGLDPALVRLVLVLLTVFGAGAGAIAYVAAWILMPEEHTS
ncbi:PspC domain-containing protein [Pseudonocardia abyssalis]|uniref:PspC domain-containing protein n=1 Tax=Pseudonocardia abyssalis TaxID=2792008 RepID=A0ABS6UZS6_9PSEU|nr:PspC domain-containing protein [Pseudonocardia abyssalis]MBW0117581.1 PspC domain-containing protein [Pseudonocardia abyssalis]MBW0137769.1 PspC domain-containing protein [Pseudonocardia abyssalis]